MNTHRRSSIQPVNILLTLDRNYLPALPAMLKSLFANNPRELFHIYLMHDDLQPDDVGMVGDFCTRNLATFIPLRVPESLFKNAPTPFHYSKAMYYRLLAFQMLPERLDKILYLDPDVLVINPVRPLYDLDISAHLFAPAAHTGLTNIATYVNQIRLNTFESQYYYNSGVLLMNLERQRERIDKEEIFAYVKERDIELVLPDQDVFNALYGKDILPLDNAVYNYDCRKFDTYFVKSGGEATMDWIMRNTVILHFCGRRKPWTERYAGRFGSLYKHYAAMAHRRPVVAGIAVSG